MFRKVILIPLLFIFTVPAIVAQTEHEQEVETEVQSAILYLDGAEVERSTSVQLKKGRNRLLFKKLSPLMDGRSIQIEVPEDVSILAVSDKRNFLNEDDDNPRIKELKDSVEAIGKELQSYRDKKSAYETEKQMLLQNQSIGGQDKGVPITELKQAADFYRNRMTEINNEISQLTRQIQEKSKSSSRLNKELQELNAKFNFNRMQVNLLLYSQTARTIPVTIKYIVRQAGWTPSYDLKAEDINKEIELAYRAKVYNNTEIDWKDIKLRLSTSDPMRSASKPELSPWYLKCYSPSYQSNKSQLYQQQAQSNAYQQSEGYIQNRHVGNEEISRGNAGDGGENIIYDEVEVSELSAEFDIPVKYSVPSDNKPYLVDITEYKLPADYKHFAIPKKDRDAFLLARITGWEDLDLVEGTANVYFGGTYVGKSYIYTRNVSDTLDLSLGRDNKILVTRTKLKEKSSTKLIGSNRQDLLTYEIVVKNNRKSSIDIEVQDQLPVSQNSDVEIDDEELSDAEHNEDTGLLKWNMTLQPGESKKLKLSFTIKYPKNKTVKYRKTKTRSVRKF